MSVILNSLKESLQRNLYMREIYEKNMQKLCKGKIRVKNISGNEYYYLVYREGNTVRTDYLGPKKKTDIAKFLQEIEDRKSYQQQIKQLKKEEKELRKAIKALGGSDEL